MSRRRSPMHDFTFAIGGGYQCSVCKSWLTANNSGAACPGLPHRLVGFNADRPADYLPNADIVGIRLVGLKG